MLNGEINNIISKQRFQNHFTDFGIIILFPNVWFVYCFLIYMCELFIANVLIWKTPTEVWENSVVGLLRDASSLSLEMQRNRTCSPRKTFARTFVLTAQQFCTDQLYSLTILPCLQVLFPAITQLITARLSFLQHLLLKSIPLLLLSYCLKPRCVLVVMPSRIGFSFLRPHCFSMIPLTTSCFGQAFLPLTWKTPRPFHPLPSHMLSYPKLFLSFLCYQTPFILQHTQEVLQIQFIWWEGKSRVQTQWHFSSFLSMKDGTSHVIQGMFICSVSSSLHSPFHCSHHAPGQCHHEEHHLVMATTRATQWHHPGLWNPVLWEGESALSAGLRDPGPAPAPWGAQGNGLEEVLR